jgi:hypothetical protein
MRGDRVAVVKEQVAIPGIGACRVVELLMSFSMVTFDVVRSPSGQ